MFCYLIKQRIVASYEFPTCYHKAKRRSIWNNESWKC
nr:MAG TPA: hypothetical protein [Caudoviricetes sp.]